MLKWNRPPEQSGGRLVSSVVCDDVIGYDIGCRVDVLQQRDAGEASAVAVGVDPDQRVGALLDELDEIVEVVDTLIVTDQQVGDVEDVAILAGGEVGDDSTLPSRLLKSKLSTSLPPVRVSLPSPPVRDRRLRRHGGAARRGDPACRCRRRRGSVVAAGAGQLVVVDIAEDLIVGVIAGAVDLGPAGQGQVSSSAPSANVTELNTVSLPSFTCSVTVSPHCRRYRRRCLRRLPSCRCRRRHRECPLPLRRLQRVVAGERRQTYCARIADEEVGARVPVPVSQRRRAGSCSRNWRIAEADGHGCGDHRIDALANQLDRACRHNSRRYRCRCRRRRSACRCPHRPRGCRCRAAEQESLPPPPPMYRCRRRRRASRCRRRRTGCRRRLRPAACRSPVRLRDCRCRCRRQQVVAEAAEPAVVAGAAQQRVVAGAALAARHCRCRRLACCCRVAGDDVGERVAEAVDTDAAGQGQVLDTGRPA